MTETTIRFGVIGCGLMGREFASATARWGHLLDMDVRPRLVAICDTKPPAWIGSPTTWRLRHAVADYRELLANPDVDAVYLAVPHHLHAEIYCAVIERASTCWARNRSASTRPPTTPSWPMPRQASPGVRPMLIRVPLLPGHAATRRHDRGTKAVRHDHRGQRRLSAFAATWTRNKPINWKRMIEFNGEYGCMGDLGMHACTCRCGSDGSRERARRYSRRSCPSGRTAKAAWRRATPGTTPCWPGGADREQHLSPCRQHQADRAR